MANKQFEATIVLGIENTKQIEQEMQKVATKVNAAFAEMGSSFRIDASSAAELEHELELAKNALDEIKKRSDQLPPGFTRATANVKQLAAQLNQAHRATVKTSLASQNVIRIIQDAPFGLFGITNNLQEMSMSFSQMLKNGMTAGQAMKATFLPLVSGPMALALVAALVSSVALRWDELGEMIDKARVAMGLMTQAQADFNKAVKKSEDSMKIIKRLIEEASVDSLRFGIAGSAAERQQVLKDLEDVKTKLREANIEAGRGGNRGAGGRKVLEDLGILKVPENIIDLQDRKDTLEKDLEEIEAVWMGGMGRLVNNNATEKWKEIMRALGYTFKDDEKKPKLDPDGGLLHDLEKVSDTWAAVIDEKFPNVTSEMIKQEISEDYNAELRQYETFIRGIYSRMADVRRNAETAAAEAVAVTGTQGTPRGRFAKTSDRIARQKAALGAGSKAFTEGMDALIAETPEHEVELLKRLNEEKLRVQADYNARSQDLNQAEMDNAEQKKQFLINTVGQTLSALGAAFGSASEEKKGMLKAGAYMDAASAAIGIYASIMRAPEIPWFLKIPLAAAQGAAVYGNLRAQIRRIDEAGKGGGDTISFGKGLTSVGVGGGAQRRADQQSIDKAPSTVGKAMSGDQRIVYSDKVAADIIVKGTRRLQYERRGI